MQIYSVSYNNDSNQLGSHKIKNDKKYHEFVVEEIQFLERKNSAEDYEDIEIPQSSDTDFNPYSYGDDDLPF